MSELNLSELKFTENDIKNFVNSSLDVEEGAVLFIDHDDKDKLDKYVDESLKKKAKLVITSLNCSSNDDKVIKAKNYSEVFLDSYNYLCNDYESKKYFGITGTNGKTTTNVCEAKTSLDSRTSSQLKRREMKKQTITLCEEG